MEKAKNEGSKKHFVSFHLRNNIMSREETTGHIKCTLMLNNYLLACVLLSLSSISCFERQVGHQQRSEMSDYHGLNNLEHMRRCRWQPFEQLLVQLLTYFFQARLQLVPVSVTKTPTAPQSSLRGSNCRNAKSMMGITLPFLPWAHH